MTRGAIDIDKLRVMLRRLSRGSLLMVVERAIEIERRRHVAAARRVSNAEQKAALRRLPARGRRR